MPGYKIFILFYLLCLITSIASAQSGIKGIVQDKSSGKKIEFTSVSIFSYPDSTLVLADATDVKGKFLVNVSPGQFYLTCTFIGYTSTSNLIKVGENKMTDAGTIFLSPDKSTLQDITVLSKKALVNNSIDRKVYNVDQDVMAQSGSASDILKNVPSVDVDIDGNVSLRGSGNVLILINGRPSPLMGKSSAAVLQQFPANTIERIEVITNPSARYKPDGTSGIINIVLKKNIKNGFNGNVAASAGNRNRYTTSANFNYRPGKINISSGISFRKDNRIRTSKIVRIEEGILNPFYEEMATSNAKPKSYLANLGLDYNIDKFNTIGISGNTLYRDLTRNDITQRKYLDADSRLALGINRLRFSPEIEKEYEATLFWQHQFKKEGHEFRLEGNIAADNETEDNRYNDIFYFPTASAYFDNTLLITKDKQQNINADYVLPIKEDLQIEVGYEGNFSQVNADFFREIFDPSLMKFTEDISRSNNFIYKDFQHAIYTTFQKEGEKFSYLAGLRAEQVLLEGNLVTLGKVFKKNYFNFYPSLHFSYLVNKSEIQLNYSRRINRPDGDELNPFPEYRDPRNLSAGNPDLQPEYISSVELGYKWQDKTFTFIPSLYYRYKKNGFTSVINKINDTTFLTTQENLSNEKSAGLELIVTIKTKSFFTANVSTNLFYNSIDASETGYTAKRSAFALSTNLNATFAITKSTVLQMTSNLRSARLLPQGRMAGNFVLNTGVKQDLFKKKLSLVLTAADILKTLRQRSLINTPFLNQVAVNRRDARIIYLGASYNFGNIQKKPKDENLQFDNNL